MRVAQAGEGDVGKSHGGCFGWKIGRGAKGVQTVLCQLLGGDVVAEVAGLCGLGDEVGDKARQVLLGVA